MSGGGILGAVGRWRQSAAVLAGALGPREQALAQAMYYAGFAAALEAMNEIADRPEDEAMQLLSGLHAEMAKIKAAAELAVGKAH